MKYCQYCEKQFSALSSLKRHVSLKHTELDPHRPVTHQCPLCPKVFTRADTLRRHRHQHVATGSACPLCARTFRKDYLHKHLRSCVRKASANPTDITNVNTRAQSSPVEGRSYPSVRWEIDEQAPPSSFQIGLKTPSPISSLIPASPALRFVQTSRPDTDAVKTTLYQQLKLAISAKDVESCRDVLENATRFRLKINDIEEIRTVTDLSLLCQAVKRGCGPIVELLLEHRADINCRDGGPREMTCLHWASLEGHAHLLQPLLRHGADVAASDSKRMTALELAVDHGQAKTVRSLLLLRGSANIFRRSSAFPFRCDREDVLRALVEGGVRQTCIRVCGKKPLIWAVNSSRMELLKLLIEKLEANTESRVMKFALHEAIRKGYVEAAVLLLTAGASTARVWADEAVMFTVLSGPEKLARLILQQNAPTIAPNLDWILDIVAKIPSMSERRQAVDLLLEFSTDSTEWTAQSMLEATELTGDPGLFKRFIGIGMIIHEELGSALNHALLFHSTEVVKALLDAGSRTSDIVPDVVDFLRYYSKDDYLSCREKILLLRQHGFNDL